MKPIRNKLLLSVFTLLFAAQLNACVMEPAIWQTVEVVDSTDDPGVFALSDALYQLRRKFSAELAACKMPELPITFVGAFYGETPVVMSSSLLRILEQSVELIWSDARVLPESELAGSPDDYVLLQKAAEKAGKESYSATIHVSDARNTAINQIDLNFWLYQLYRCVMREELKVFIRITDSSGTAVFIDEIAVSPTVMVDPIISPLGGYIIRFEKNTASPLMVDFGPLTEGAEHQLRFNEAYRQPSETPPLPEFKKPLAGSDGCSH
ncbi:MAG: hypothetical protein A2W80_02195 [Candidatus Riflebacteria bacterium GWC2_50_8]|nr:MAG: hypothetical protein A2W80_02195 [Candidatus Riflebacteria bacterium GWC2_50_8]